MLQNIREKFTGPTAIIVGSLIVVPFVFFGVSSPFIGSGYAAKVDGDEISQTYFESTWQNQVAQNPDYLSYPPQFQNMLREQVLDGLIRDRLVIGYVDDSGMRISEKMVTDLIQQIPAYQLDGQFSMEQYRTVLANEGRSTTEFETTVARSLVQYQLQQSIVTTAFVTPAEYRRYLNLFAQQRQVTIATIEFEAIKESVDVSDGDIAEFYESRPDEFLTNETVDLEFIEIRRDTLSANAVISEDELQRHYEEASSRYMQDEQRQARHILIPFGDDEEADRELAKSLTARADAGEPFDSLAKQYSKDGMTANNGGDLGLIFHSQMPDALGDVIFSMKKGQVQGPIKSDFGFHVVRLDEIVEGGPLPLEQVRAELEAELRESEAGTEFSKLENILSDALFDSLDIQSMAEAAGLEVQTASGYTRAGGEPFGSNQAAIEAVFDARVLNDGEISDFVELDANRSVILKVAEYNQATRQPLEEVSDSIRGALQSARAQEIIAERSLDLQTALRRGDDINEVAEKTAALVNPGVVVTRTTQSMDARLLAAIFRTKKPLAGKPQIGSAVTAEGDYAVFSLAAVTDGRPESIPLSDRDTRKQELASQSGIADFTAFLSQLEQQADIVKNDDVLQSEDTF